MALDLYPNISAQGFSNAIPTNFLKGKIKMIDKWKQNNTHNNKYACLILSNMIQYKSVTQYNIIQYDMIQYNKIKIH